MPYDSINVDDALEVTSPVTLAILGSTGVGPPEGVPSARAPRNIPRIRSDGDGTRAGRDPFASCVSGRPHSRGLLCPPRGVVEALNGDEVL
jgi:hypothetical protein